MFRHTRLQFQAILDECNEWRKWMFVAEPGTGSWEMTRSHHACFDWPTKTIELSTL